MKQSFALLAVLLAVSFLPLSAAPLKVAQAMPFRPALRPGAEFKSTGETYSVLLDQKTGMFGKWTLVFKVPDNVEACKFQVRHNAGENAVAKGLIVCSASWLDENDRNVEAGYLEAESGDFFNRTLRCPKGVKKVALTLGVRHFYQEVTFKDVVCEPVEMPVRNVRIITAKLPDPAAGPVQMDAVWNVIAKAGEKPDLVIIPEAAPVSGVKAAQPIPGPHTEWAAGWAKKLKTNVVVGMTEVQNGRFYRSAAVIDRDGQLVGVYRKIHLVPEEYENGFHWGDDWAVFDLDFGKTGVLIGSDLTYPEAVRSLRLRGAEVIACPVGNAGKKVYDVMWRVRAMENGVVVAAASAGKADTPSRILLPDGLMLKESYVFNRYAAGTVDLNDLPLFLQYLSVGSGSGETRSFYIYERHPELYRELSDKR